MPPRETYRPARRLLLLLLCLVLTACGLTPPRRTAPPPEGSSFAIHFIDVGQGDSALVLCDGAAMLIDGGENHVKIARRVLDEFGLDIPAFGMVKDDRHRTRALVAPDGREIGIQAIPAVFALIGQIQEETHRFAIEFNRQQRKGRVQGSVLDQIPGVGEKRRAQLLKAFKSVKAIRQSPLEELEKVVPKNTAQAVYQYFRREEIKNKRSDMR